MIFVFRPTHYICEVDLISLYKSLFVGYENNDKKFAPVYENKVKAGKKRTYFFDIKEARNSGFSLVITESRKRFDDRGYDRTSIFIYQEDINKFVKGLNEAVDYIKTELLPDYNFDEYDNYNEEGAESEKVVAASTPVVEDVTEVGTVSPAEIEIPKHTPPHEDEIVDKW